MIFADIENIWTVDLATLSNADRGRVYFERAKQVVADVLIDSRERGVAIRNARFSRSYLVGKIGCQPAVTTQNPKIKQLLSRTDKRLMEEADRPGTAAERRIQGSSSSGMAKLRATIDTLCRRVEVQASSDVEVRTEPRPALTRIASTWASGSPARRLSPSRGAGPTDGLIVNTDTSCNVKGQSWPDIPTLVWPEGIDETASDWLRHVVVECGVAASSAREYAKVIRPFFRFCRERNRAWQTVDDEFLILWREHLRRAMSVEVQRVNTSLKTIFALYRWAEENKRIRFQVGIYTENELPAGMADVVFPISAKRIFSKGRHGRVYGSWTTPLTLSQQQNGSRHIRHTPTEEEIRRLHEIAGERIHGERDSLMFSWAEEAGPRRSEFLRLSKSHMPTSDQLADLIERDEPWRISIQRKGGKTTPLNAPPDLLIRTLDFINFGRREIVEHCRSCIVGYREPNEIFLSGTTGMPLHPDSATSIGRRSFRKAGIGRANIHRLRARFAVRTIETLVDAIFEGQIAIGSESSWVETILIKAAEIMGHSTPMSLKPYLTYVLNRRIQTADATKAERLSSRLRQLRLQESTLVRRLRQSGDLHAVARLIQVGRNVEAASTLKRIAEELA
jgi:integrase